MTNKVKSVFTVSLKSIAFAWQTNRKLFLLIIFLNLLMGSLVYIQYTSFASIVDEIIKIKQGLSSTAALISYSLILGASFVVPMVVSTVLVYIRMKFRMKQEVQLALYKIDKQSALDASTIESASYQHLLRSAQEWGSSSILSLQDFTFSSAANFSSIITSMIILWSLNAWLVMFACLAALPVYFFYKRYSMEVFRIRHLAIDDHRIISNRLSHFEELSKAIDVLLLRLKGWLRDQISERKIAYNKKIEGAELKKAVSYMILSLWYLLFLFAAIALVTVMAMEGSIAVGGLLLAFNTYTRFYQTINGYVESISHTEEAARYAARWFELFDLKPRIKSKNDAIRVSFTEPPLIEFKNVSFRYPSEASDNHFVLRNLTFSIRKGEKVAIIGVNGAGKTTLIKLFCRIYDPTEGEILVNGYNLKDISLEDWQQTIGILLQDFPVYNLTMRESISIGKVFEKEDAGKIRQAARFSGADEFITDYEQLIWKDFKGGIDLSKGQHQRMAVARIFYRNAPITILDEPTASIDAFTEEKIFNSLEKNMEGRTVILITHRFNSVKSADKILLLEHGLLIEQGRHKELMSLNKKYAELYTMQARRYREDSEVVSR